MSEDLDFAGGIALEMLEEGRALLGRVGQAKVFILRKGSSIQAFSATCSHLGGPLQDGLIEGTQIVCPWHHACFDLSNGKALTAPAFNPLERYNVDVCNDRVVVSEKIPSKEKPVASLKTYNGGKQTLVIVGGGAAGFAAVHTLRERGWQGRISMYSADNDPPYDRTLLTKDYLDGHFGDDRLPIAKDRLPKLAVSLELGTMVAAVNAETKQIALSDGRTLGYHKLLLATGSTPKRPEFPGANQANVFVLRTLADCRRLLAATADARRITVVGGSFIGLEAAASLRSLGIEVEIVVPQKRPLSKLLGRELSDLIVNTLMNHGVQFHLGRKPQRIEADSVILDDGTTLQADAILLGIGVTANTTLAQAAGLAVEDGVVLDEHLRTSHPDIYAAGDLANWPERHTRQRRRVEHWVVAQRQGQVAAANMLGAREAFCEVPFFWSKFFDLSFRYVGYAQEWDRVAIDGDLDQRSACLRYSKNGRDIAVATVGRDRDALLAKLAFRTGLGDQQFPAT